MAPNTTLTPEQLAAKNQALAVLLEGSYRFVFNGVFSPDGHDWLDAGSPHNLYLVESDDLEMIEVYEDLGWGGLFVFDGERWYKGKTQVYTPHRLIMDKEYFGLSKYIWR